MRLHSYCMRKFGMHSLVLINTYYQGSEAIRSKINLAMESGHPFLILDIDGYGQNLPKECGYCYFSTDSCQAGSLYFDCGPHELNEIQRKSQEEKHGLPLDGFEVKHSLLEDHLFSSKEVKTAIKQLIDKFKGIKKIGEHESFFVYHKGGPEGKLLKEVSSEMRNVYIKDLEFYGCPKYDELMELCYYLNEAKRHSTCNLSANHGFFNENNEVRRVVHCPQMECIAFGTWFNDYLARL